MKHFLQKMLNPKAWLIAFGLVSMMASAGNAQAPYCAINYANTYSGYGFTQVTIGTYTQSPTFNNKYMNFLTQNIAVNAGVVTNVSFNTSGWVGVGVAADFNNDNDFEDAGEVLFVPQYNGSAANVTYSGTIIVPPYVLSGNYRLRIWTRTANGGGANEGIIPCGAYNYGRYADYTLVVTNNATCIAPSNVTSVPTSNSAALSWTASTSAPANYRWKVVADGADPVTAPAAATGTTSSTTANATSLISATAYDAYVKSLCSASDSSVWTLVNDFTTLCDGTPATGVAAASVATACPTVNFNLTLTGVTPAPGISYQWQSSPTATGTFTNIAGGTTTTFATSQTATTYYRCLVTCAGSSLTSTSNVVSVGMNIPTNCYCIPTSTNGSSYFITDFSTSGGLTNITNNGTGSGSYNPYLSQSASALLTSTVNFSITTSSGFIYRSIYIDWNQDGAFDETTEKVYTGNYPTISYVNTTQTGSFVVPATATVGPTRMRVRTAYYSSTTMHACNNLSYGEAEDYTFNVVSPVGVCINPLNLAVSGVTQSSASISFVAPTVGNTPTNYIYELRTSGTPGSGATGLTSSATTTNTTVNFTTLASTTNYVFYVRTFCSVGDSSIWVSIPFSTTLTPVSLGQFSADVIANGIGTAMSSTTNDVDGASYALIAADYQLTSTSTLPTSALPNNRIAQNGFRKYRLENYSLNNSLRQLNGTSAAVRFLAPKQATKVYILGISGSGASNFNAIVHFADGTTQSQAMSYPDWYNAGNNVVSGVGRIDRSNNSVQSGGPILHDTSMTISASNINKQIDSIVIQRTGSASGVSNILAVSIVPNANQSCKLPSYLTISNTNCMGGLLEWTGNGINTNYQISYGPIGTLVNNGTIITVNGGSTGTNTHQFVNTTTNTSLQMYVRAVCGSGSYSDWVGPLEVVLPSVIVTPSFTLPSDICQGSTAPLLPATSNNNVAGTWSPAIVSNTNTNNYTFTPTAAFPCAVPVTVTINVSGQIIPTFTQIAPFCNGTTAPSLASTSLNGFAGTWSPSTISNTTSGTYTFTPTTSGSTCLGIATMDIVVKPTANEVETIQICSEELPYVWNNITVTQGGTNAATFVVPGVNSCDSTTILNLDVIVNTNPTINLSASPSVNAYIGQTITFTANLVDAAGSNPTIKWYKSGNLMPGVTGTTWVAVAGTDFLNGEVIYAIAEGFNNCAAVQSTSSNQLEMSVSLSVGNNPKPESFKLYPNPTNSFVTVEGLEKDAQFYIVDAIGRIIIAEKVVKSGKVNIDLNRLPSGMYMAIFQNADGYRWTQKINKL